MTSPNMYSSKNTKVVYSSQSSGVKPGLLHSYNQVSTRQGNHRVSSKNSFEPSINQITPTQRTHITNNGENQNKKQPLYSMVPDKINKYAQNNTILSQQDPNIKPLNVMYCEESEIMKPYGLCSQATLTPQKCNQMPASPCQKPILSNCSKINSEQQQNRVGAQYQYQMENRLQNSSSKKLNSSGQKSTVVYNEFKYYTSGEEILNSQNQKKFVNISNSAFTYPRRSEQQQNNLQFELSPTDHKIFDMSSPQQSMISQLPGLRGNSLRQQTSNQPTRQDAYLLQLKTTDTEELNYQFQPEAEAKIKELKDYIEHLENDLKESQMKNIEIKQKFKEKSFIQSIDQTKKHISDTEDSLILSEKKGKKRNSNSGTRPGPNNSMQQVKQNANSIVDLKIRQLSNQKERQSVSPYRRKENTPLSKSKHDNPRKKNEDPSSILEYQVQDYNDYSTNSALNEDLDQDTSQHQHQSDDECEGCERLKQLVFQAKEAIDDLKLEIEEWRDLCSEKETELRQLQHKIYNDIVGVDKKIDFNEDVQTKEFDTNKPVNADSRRIRNFVQANKKRIRSRSKNNMKGKESTFTQRKASTVQSSALKKKPALKNVKELINEDIEFYEAEDQGIQTSFHAQSTNDYNTNATQSCDNEGFNTNQANNDKYISINSAMQTNRSPSSLKENLFQVDDGLQQELSNLRSQNQFQESEISRLKLQLNTATKQCEQFMNLIKRTKTKVNKKQPQIDIDEIKQNYEILSNIESYSILEKINEWKREEGLIDANEMEPPSTQIPRPVKLIMDIDISDLESIPETQPTSTTPMKQNAYDSNKKSENVQQELMNLIKQEQEQLKMKQDAKYRELQRQQQDYLNKIKGM